MAQNLASYIDGGLWCFRALMVKKGVCSRGYYGSEKIDDIIREQLDKKLKGLSLNLGSGFTNHYTNSVNLDISFHSLDLNDRKGVLYNLNTINYNNSLKNPEKVFLELQRVVKPKGRVVIVNQNNIVVEELRVRGNNSDDIIDEGFRYFYRTYFEKVPFEGGTIDFIELELA